LELDLFNKLSHDLLEWIITYGDAMSESFEEKRAIPRDPGTEYHSVEFYPETHACAYQFRLWNLSSEGVCFLVKKESFVLDALNIGDVLDMKFYGPDDSQAPKTFKAEIRHITWKEEGRFKSHYLVGLSILEGQET
jgi:hypothetical protein